jgi:hypothetical protein
MGAFILGYVTLRILFEFSAFIIVDLTRWLVLITPKSYITNALLLLVVTIRCWGCQPFYT